MIDGPPVNTQPPGEFTKHTLGFIYVPSMWALGAKVSRMRARLQAEVTFNAKTILLPACWPSEYHEQFKLDDFAKCAECVGCVIFRDLMQPIPYGAQQMLDFFFGRDKAEALVYQWRPWEKDFALVDREWLDHRRRG